MAEVLSFLAPGAFVFAIAATSQVAALRKELTQLAGEVERIRAALSDGE